MSSPASFSTTRFCGPTRSRDWPCRRWPSSAARSRIAAATTLSFASSSISLRAPTARVHGACRCHGPVRCRPHRHCIAGISRLELGRANTRVPAAGGDDRLAAARGMALLALYAVVNLCRQHGGCLESRRRVCVAAGRGDATRELWLPWFSGDAAITAALLLFFVAIFAGVPVGFVLLLATAAYCGSPTPRRWSCCRRPWSTAPAISSCWPCRSSSWRADHGARRHQRAAGALHPHAGRAHARRAAAGHGREHVRRFGPVRLEARRRGRRRERSCAISCASGTARRGRGRACRGGHHGRDGAAEHRHADRRLDHERVGRRRCSSAA